MEWKSVGMMTFPIYGKIKFRFQTTNQIKSPNIMENKIDVWNHQPANHSEEIFGHNWHGNHRRFSQWFWKWGSCYSCVGSPQDPKLEVPTIYKAYVREYPNKIWSYMVQYLHIRILKFPLNMICLRCHEMFSLTREGTTKYLETWTHADRYGASDQTVLQITAVLQKNNMLSMGNGKVPFGNGFESVGWHCCGVWARWMVFELWQLTVFMATRLPSGSVAYLLKMTV